MAHVVKGSQFYLLPMHYPQMDRTIPTLYSVMLYYSQRILPLPNDAMFGRSSSADKLSKSPQLLTRNQMPRSTSNIASAANAVVAAFDPVANAQYGFHFIQAPHCHFLLVCLVFSTQDDVFVLSSLQGLTSLFAIYRFRPNGCKVNADILNICI